jgi:hypothetical protein
LAHGSAALRRRWWSGLSGTAAVENGGATIVLVVGRSFVVAGVIVAVVGNRVVAAPRIIRAMGMPVAVDVVG